MIWIMWLGVVDDMDNVVRCGDDMYPLVRCGG